MQKEFFSSEHVAVVADLPEEQVRNKVYDERWDRVPPPAGKAARRIYWERAAVERWYAERRAQNG